MSSSFFSSSFLDDCFWNSPSSMPFPVFVPRFIPPPPFVVVVVVPLFITCFFWLSRRQFYTIVPVAMVAQSAATVRNLRWTRLTGGLDATQWIKKRRGELFGPITTNRWLRKRRQIKKRLCATLELLKRKNNKYFKSNRILKKTKQNKKDEGLKGRKTWRHDKCRNAFMYFLLWRKSMAQWSWESKI